jgi:outer membrane murein-binding lipoprotein Lpp
MVLTIRVVTAVDGHTRRGFLGAVAGTAIVASTTGCSAFDDPDPDKPDALQPLLDEALTLAATFDRAAVAVPALAARLTPLAADHRAHAAELTRVIGKPAPTPGASSAAPGTAEPVALLKQLRAAVKAAQRTAATAGRQAPAERAALVGSIAACRAAHAEALR